MRKAIMISIKPKLVAKILNGEKTIEIRKNMPKCDLPIDVYIYCTKDKQGIFKERHNGYTLLNQNKWIQSEMNGKVVAKFTLNNVEEYINGHNCDYIKHNASSCLDFEKILKPSCVNEEELYLYAEDLHFYAWYINNLEIFDEPKELSEFKHLIKGNKLDHFIDAINYVGGLPLTKAPQSWRYVEVE